MSTTIHNPYDAHLFEPQYRNRLDDAEVTREWTRDDEAEASGTHAAAVAAATAQPEAIVFRLRGALLRVCWDDMVSTGAEERGRADGGGDGMKNVLIGLGGVGWEFCTLPVAACLMCA